MPALGEISNQSNIKPGEFDPAWFKPKSPEVSIETKVNRFAVQSTGPEGNPTVSTAGIAAFKNNLSLPLKIIGVIRHTTNATTTYLKKTSPLIKGIKATKYLSLVTFPFGLYDFFNASKDVIKAGTLDQKLDAGLAAVSEMSGLMESAVTMGEGLNEAGVLAKSAIQWTTPLTVISAALSVSSIILTIRGLWQSCNFRNEMDAKLEISKSVTPNLQDYIATLEYLEAKDDAFLKKHFKVDGGKLKKQIEKIDQEAKKVLQSGNAAEIEESAQKMKTTIAALKGRVNDKIVSHSLSLVSHSVGLVGLGVLMTQPQLAPVAFSLFAVSSATSVGRLIFDEVKKRQFETAIGLREPKPKKQPENKPQKLISELKARLAIA